MFEVKVHNTFFNVYIADWLRSNQIYTSNTTVLHKKYTNIQFKDKEDFILFTLTWSDKIKKYHTQLENELGKFYNMFQLEWADSEHLLKNNENILGQT